MKINVFHWRYLHSTKNNTNFAVRTSIGFCRSLHVVVSFTLHHKFAIIFKLFFNILHEGEKVRKVQDLRDGTNRNSCDETYGIHCIVLEHWNSISLKRIRLTERIEGSIVVQPHHYESPIEKKIWLLAMKISRSTKYSVEHKLTEKPILVNMRSVHGVAWRGGMMRGVTTNYRLAGGRAAECVQKLWREAQLDDWFMCLDMRTIIEMIIKIVWCCGWRRWISKLLVVSIRHAFDTIY